MLRALGEDYRRGSEAKKDWANQNGRKKPRVVIQHASPKGGGSLRAFRRALTDDGFSVHLASKISPQRLQNDAWRALK